MKGETKNILPRIRGKVKFAYGIICMSVLQCYRTYSSTELVYSLIRLHVNSSLIK